MLNSALTEILIITGIIFAALVFIGVVIARLYTRSSKEVSFVRTGFGGEKVILNGGAIVLPVLHEIIPVNMNTLRLEVKRAADQALITRDRMRVDVMAEFYVRVKPTAESIATEGNLSTLYVPLLPKWLWKNCMRNVLILCKKFNKSYQKIYLKMV